jgi:hypothetical protein
MDDLLHDRETWPNSRRWTLWRDAARVANLLLPGTGGGLPMPPGVRLLDLVRAEGRMIIPYLEI